MASFKIYRIVTTTTSVPFNFVLGTTSTATVNAVPADKGLEVNFQNQSTAATNVWVGGSTMLISIGATSTQGAGGIMISQNGVYSVGKQDSASAIQMTDWYVASTSSNAICVAQLINSV